MTANRFSAPLSAGCIDDGPILCGGLGQCLLSRYEDFDLSRGENKHGAIHAVEFVCFR